LRRIALAVLLILAPATGWAADIPTLGPLARFVQLGQAGAWTSAVEDGRFVLHNPGTAGVIRDLHVSTEHPMQMSARVKVEAEPSEQLASGAGLIYGRQGEGKDRLYYALLIESGGRISLYRRDQGGFSRLISQKNDKFASGTPIELSIRETGKAFDYFANGEKLGSFGGRGVGEGSVGIIAVGPGKFTFENFRLGKAAAK